MVKSQGVLRMIGVFFNLISLIAPRFAAKKGLALLCHPFRSKLNERHKAFFNSARSYHIPHEKGYVQAYRWGNGVLKILFIHGWQSHSYLWKRYVESLDLSRYSVYAFDAPAHGQTSGNFLTLPTYGKAIGNVLKYIGKVDHVVAHSIGGFALLHRLYNEPHLMPPSIVLLSTPGRVRDFFSAFEKRLSLSNRCMQLIESEFEMFAGEQIDDFIATRYAKSIASLRLLIHDQKDSEIPIHYSREIHQAAKDSILIETRGLGHNLKSDRVVELIVNYINTGQLSERSMVTLAELEH